MTDTKTLTFVRALTADPARVYRALTSAEARMAWGPPGPDQVVIIENQPEAAPGLREHSRCGPADNPYVDVHTDWILLEPERIAYAETLLAEGTTLGTSLAVFDLTQSKSGTDLAATIMVASYIGDEMFAEFEAGWTHAMENLTQHLE
ncbi:SRPBCC domain-containing protein [Gymnodinialimonas sp. 2305UL16-5]|uniref:SRPBCC domain-containing protein n=1 Tax=Gymnodinialimonas mytili TaxID=3126503 RepID=UPI0030983981